MECVRSFGIVGRGVGGKGVVVLELGRDGRGWGVVCFVFLFLSLFVEINYLIPVVARGIGGLVALIHVCYGSCWCVGRFQAKTGLGRFWEAVSVRCHRRLP